MTEADGTGLALHFFRKPVWDRVQVGREGEREGGREGGCDKEERRGLPIWDQVQVGREEEREGGRV